MQIREFSVSLVSADLEPQRQADEALAKLNLSFSPGFSLGSQRDVEFRQPF